MPDDMPSELRQRFERLEDRLAYGQVLPFVGAGISVASWVEGDNDFRPTLAWMKQRLADALRKELIDMVREGGRLDRGGCGHLRLLLALICPDWDRGTRTQRLLEAASQAWQEDDRDALASTLDAIDLDGEPPCLTLKTPAEDTPSLAEAAERCCPPDTVSFDRLAEVAVWLWGQESVCELLRIDSFADLEPLPAHRYLAYLAREGLVTEVITTNYDACIERAFERSFGDDEAAAQDALAPIRGLREYLERGGCQLTEGHPQRPILHLYKINGCAREYRQYRQGTEVVHRLGPCFEPLGAERIAFTERQLQTFGQERWVEDLFQDRSRTHALLFCGFGSEEPQVRHTALRLMEELGRLPRCGDEALPEQVASLPNAPFVAAYEDLTFTQVQVLSAFMQAHRQSRPGPARIAEASLNAFCGNDARELDSDQQDGGSARLSADLFLAHVYLLGLKRRLLAAIGEDSPFLKWLDQQGQHARDWGDYLRRCLFAVEGEDGADDWDRLFGAQRALFTLDPSQPRAPLPFQHWLAAMERPLEDHVHRDWYLPVQEDSLLITLTLTLLLALTGTQGPDASQEWDAWTQRVAPRRGLGLGVRTVVRPPHERETGTSTPLSEASTTREVTVYLVTEGSGDQADPAGLSPGTRLFRRLAVPSMRYLERERRWSRRVATAGGLDTLYSGVILTVAAEELFRLADSPSDLPARVKRVFSEQPPGPRARLQPL